MTVREWVAEELAPLVRVTSTQRTSAVSNYWPMRFPPPAEKVLRALSRLQRGEDALNVFRPLPRLEAGARDHKSR